MGGLVAGGREMQMRLLVTGTPCVGKTILARRLAHALGARLVDANALVKEKGFWENAREKTVDLCALRRALKKLLREKNVVAEGHLLCEFSLPRVDSVVVLRCNPLVLAKRLRARGYSRKKISENILAEALDYCLVKSEENYGKKVIQVDATRLPSTQSILRKIKRGKSDFVDWSPLLLRLLRSTPPERSRKRFKKVLDVF